MPHYFFDTSALVKYYHTEIGSPKVIAIVDASANISFISRVTLVEMHSAFARRVRTGEITDFTFYQWRKRFFADLRSRRFRIIRSSHLHEREAMRFLVKRGLVHSLRTLDALQLAAAAWLRDQGRLDWFVCADATLCAVAQLEAVPVVNPETP